ncbi:FAD-dependent oxidoreductase [Cryobacterium aureum]|uniref:FAD-dependent oxidoreductase n=1 Tax=Cryobacterium aureum TaxID=995037 RepID=UPI000CF37C6A|nr:FAD-dependent oxidoreductase [Cryobacterium aureum]
MTTPRSARVNDEFGPSIRQYDVVVIGSGAGGLAAAVTAAHAGLSVVVLERASVCGGATSWSGGWMWVPGNPLAQAAGVYEQTETFRTYLRAALGADYDAERIDAFLEAAPRMIDFFHSTTSLQFVPGDKVNDIYGNLAGAGTGNRSVAPKPINARHFSRSLRKKLRPQLYETSFLGMGIMAGADLTKFLSASRGNPRGLLHAGMRVTQYIFDLVTAGRGMHLVNGTALIGRLMKSADDLGATILVNSPATALLTDSTGRVTGVVADTPTGPVDFHARLGVVLATGGFSRDVDRRRELFPHNATGQEHWTLAPETADGSGISLGESVGGHLVTAGFAPAAWCPVSLVPYRNGRVGTFPHIMDRAKPGSIGVLRSGKRFVNEANGYWDYVTAMNSSTPSGGTVEAWQIADSTFVRRYPLGMAKPLPVPLFPYLRNGYLTKGRTLDELAAKCGIDPTELGATVQRFNENARVGLDPEFQRGQTPFNRYGGDPRNSHPNPSLAPIEKGPFYAVRVLPGSFGTFAGLETDARSRLLDAAGRAIEGIYVVGVDQANVMGGHYPAGGVNIGPAMTFGFAVGELLAGNSALAAQAATAEAPGR